VNGLGEMVTAATEVIGPQGSSYDGYGTEFSTLWSAYTGAANTGGASIISANSSGGGIVGSLISGIIGSISVPDMLGDAQGYNPIIVLMKEGRQLIETVAKMWVGALTISFITGLVAGICESTNPTGTAFQAALTWLKSIFMLLTTVLLAPGVILYYYVPLYPFAVFTFAAIGWVMMVVEGMAAAPLICVGITHPEGHDFLGKSEQALMFFLGIFVRPALLIIGLIASMLVSFVAFQIFISGYAHIMPASISESGLYAVFVDLIEYVMGILIFGMFTMELTEQSYKLIFQLPQYVMKWIGGPEMGQDYAGMAGQVRGAISGGASGVGQAAEPLAQFGKGVGQAPGEAYKAGKSKNQQGQEESGSSTISTSGGGDGGAGGASG